MKAILISVGVIIALWGLGYAGLWFFIEYLARGNSVHKDAKTTAVSSIAIGICGLALVFLAERLL